MKTKRKALLLSLCAVLLVVASVMGTMAYLTSTATVTNTFTVGDAVTITLDEAKVNPDGTPVTGADAARVTQNSYRLMPGHKYTKDPTVHVTGGECYVFVKVTNGLTGLEAEANTIEAQMEAKGWKAVTSVDGLYVYATGSEAKTAVSGDPTATNLTVFEKFTIKDTAVHGDLEKAKDIVITAYAVQTDGFESMTPADIWTEAFGS